MSQDQSFRYIPKRKISEAEKQIIMLRIEKVKLLRERSLIILNKSIMLFFAFLAVAVVGLVTKTVSSRQLNFLIVLGLIALVVGIIPYGRTARKEEEDLEKTIDELTN